MMRLTTAFTSVLFSSTTAFAHSGHISHLAGHSHFVAVGAALVALVIGAGAFVAYKRSKNV